MLAASSRVKAMPTPASLCRASFCAASTSVRFILTSYSRCGSRQCRNYLTWEGTHGKARMGRHAWEGMHGKACMGRRGAREGVERELQVDSYKLRGVLDEG